MKSRCLHYIGTGFLLTMLNRRYTHVEQNSHSCHTSQPQNDPHLLLFRVKGGIKLEFLHHSYINISYIFFYFSICTDAYKMVGLRMYSTQSIYT